MGSRSTLWIRLGAVYQTAGPYRSRGQSHSVRYPGLPPSGQNAISPSLFFSRPSSFPDAAKKLATLLLPSPPTPTLLIKSKARARYLYNRPFPLPSSLRFPLPPPAPAYSPPSPSSPPPLIMSSAMQRPTLTNVHIRSAADAHKLFYAVQLGLLPKIEKRLDANERAALRPGDVYVWEEKGPNTDSFSVSMERFTEGKSWTASRVREVRRRPIFPSFSSHAARTLRRTSSCISRARAKARVTRGAPPNAPEM